MSTDQVFGKEYYDKAYKDYERQNPPGKMAFYRELVTMAAPPVARPVVLDIGCAFGGFLAGLNEHWSLHGIDRSEYAVSKAREKLPHVRFAVSDVLDIPFQNPFHIITAFDVIEHVGDLERVGQAISSRLTVNGLLIFVVPVYDGPLGPLVRLLDHDTTHIHKESRQFWLTWVSRFFYVEQWFGIFRYLVPQWGYVHWPTGVVRRWAPAIAVVARRRDPS